MSKRKLKATREIFADLKEYKGLNKAEREYIQQFYRENYTGTSGIEKDPILTVDDHLKEARRRDNSLYRDAMSATLNQNKLIYTPDETMVLEEASDNLDWENAFAADGYELAVQVIFDLTVRDLEVKALDNRTVLARFYIKMERLRKLDQRDRKNK